MHGHPDWQSKSLASELERTKFELESLQHVVALKSSEGKDMRVRLAAAESQVAATAAVCALLPRG